MIKENNVIRLFGQIRSSRWSTGDARKKGDAETGVWSVYVDLWFLLLRRWSERKNVYCRPMETDMEGANARWKEQPKKLSDDHFETFNHTIIGGTVEPTHAIDAYPLNGIRSHLIFGRTFETHLLEIEIEIRNVCRFARLQHYILLHEDNRTHTERTGAILHTTQIHGIIFVLFSIHNQNWNCGSYGRRRFEFLETMETECRIGWAIPFVCLSIECNGYWFITYDINP